MAIAGGSGAARGMDPADAVIGLEVLLILYHGELLQLLHRD